MILLTRALCFFLIFLSATASARLRDWPPRVAEIMQRREDQANQAYASSRFSEVSRDYLARFSRDLNAKASPGEIVFERVAIILPKPASEVSINMAETLQKFLTERMLIQANISGNENAPPGTYLIKFQLQSNAFDSVNIYVNKDQTIVVAASDDGIRDGTLKLIDQMGIKSAPILNIGSATLRTKVAERIGNIPWLGSMRDVVLMGFNSVLLKPYFDLHEISNSSVLPELATLQNPQSLTLIKEMAREARRWGLRPYIHINNRTRFADDHPIFAAHPSARGVKVQAGEGYILSTNSEVVQRYIESTFAGLFRAVPELSGAMIIVGGEGFYHCYMHPQGFPKGKTDTRSCGSAGPDETVANLVNTMTKAARSINPDARILVWPYSAHHVWSSDATQSQLIQLMDPAAILQTEVINGEVVRHSDGIETSYWDYSVGALGPSVRAARQIQLGHEHGMRVYVHSEPELSLDFGGVPFLPSPSRWLARAGAVANSGADGVVSSPYFKEFYASLGAEIQKFAWLYPDMQQEDVVQALAKRAAGSANATLVKAWKLIGDAIAASPQVPTYFTGPQFLGPAHPLILDPDVGIPEIYAGQLLYLAERSEAEALNVTRSIVRMTPEVRGVTRMNDDGSIVDDMPAANNIDSFMRRYRIIEGLLKSAVQAFDLTIEAAPQNKRLALESEASVVRWFSHTARTTANFYESNLVNKCVVNVDLNYKDRSKCYQRLLEIVADERQNSVESLSVIRSDPRLDVYYHPFLAFGHSEDMISEKIKMIDRDIAGYLLRVEPKLQ